MAERKNCSISNKAGKTITVFPCKKELYDAVKERENNVIGRRIQQARMSRGLSLPAFAEMLSQHGLSVHRPGVWKWETGGSVPNAYQLIAICHALGIEDGIAYFTQEPGLGEELNETGLKKVAEYKADLIATGLYRQRPVYEDNEETIEMDISLLEASAGTGDILDEGGFEKVSFPLSAVPSNADFGVRVHGDSMEPVYHDGQIVWVKRCETLLPGDIGIFVYDGNGYLKKYGEREPEEPDREGFVDSNGVLHPQPLLISYNPAYAPIQVSPQAMFRVVGQVLN